MPGENNIKTFSAADIEQYHKGLLSAKERHALEKAALDDPFLADALEGYSGERVAVAEDLAELKARLQEKTERNKVVPMLPSDRKTFSWWKVAAMIVLVAGAGLLVYQFAFNNKPNDIAQAAQDGIAGENKPADSIIRAKNDTGVNVVATNANAANSSDTPALSESYGVVSGSKKHNTGKAGLPAKDSDARQTPVPAATSPAENLVAQKAEIQDENGLVELQRIEEQNAAKEVTAQYRQLPRHNRLPVDAGRDGADKQASIEAKTKGFVLPSKQNVFRGRVTDSSDNALPFTNITNLEDTVGTYTDVRGYFVLTSPDSVLHVQVKSLGYATNNIKLSDINAENKIKLEEDRSLNARILDTARRNINRTRHSSMTLEDAEPVDGWGHYDTYLVNNLKVPETFKSRQGGGEVELSFDVDSNGEPINITVKRSLCESCDREAIRLLKEGPKWKRKNRKGKTTVTVSF